MCNVGVAVKVQSAFIIGVAECGLWDREGIIGDTHLHFGYRSTLHLRFILYMWYVIKCIMLSQNN